MKTTIIVSLLTLAAILAAACSRSAPAAPMPAPTATPTANAQTGTYVFIALCDAVVSTVHSKAEGPVMFASIELDSRVPGGELTLVDASSGQDMHFSDCKVSEGDSGGYPVAWTGLRNITCATKSLLPKGADEFDNIVKSKLIAMEYTESIIDTNALYYFGPDFGRGFFTDCTRTGD